MKERFVIVGTGIAGLSAAKAIREINTDAEILMIGNEKFYPYNRVKLSKSLFDVLQEEALLLQKKEWYEINNIKIKLGINVSRLDMERQELILSDGTKEKYGKLLLASGARNTKPPISGIDCPEVFSLRGLEDALHIHGNIEKVKEAVIIGAGSQGLETAWILHQHGKKVIIVQRNWRLMPRELDEAGSRILQRYIEKQNIQVLLSTQFDNITVGETVECNTKDGEKIECDMVIYSAGISPNIGYLNYSPVKINRGIIVDEKMSTNVENIYAAGDVAEYDERITGLWNIAIAQGKTAGYNMAGKETKYEHIVPVTTLNAFGVSLFSMGRVDENENIKSIISEDLSGDTYNRIFVEKHRIVGAIVIGDIKKSPVLKSAIENEISLENVNLDKITADELLYKLKNKEI